MAADGRPPAAPPSQCDKVGSFALWQVVVGATDGRAKRSSVGLPDSQLLNGGARLKRSLTLARAAHGQG